MNGIVSHSQSSQNSKFAISLQYPKKEVRNEVEFLDADKNESFPQVDFNTLDIKVFYKVIVSLLMDMVKHFHSTQVTSLQYLDSISKKKLGMSSFFACR